MFIFQLPTALLLIANCLLAHCLIAHYQLALSPVFCPFPQLPAAQDGYSGYDRDLDQRPGLQLLCASRFLAGKQGSAGQQYPKEGGFHGLWVDLETRYKLLYKIHHDSICPFIVMPAGHLTTNCCENLRGRQSRNERGPLHTGGCIVLHADLFRFSRGDAEEERRRCGIVAALCEKVFCMLRASFCKLPAARLHCCMQQCAFFVMPAGQLTTNCVPKYCSA